MAGKSRCCDAKVSREENADCTILLCEDCGDHLAVGDVLTRFEGQQSRRGYQEDHDATFKEGRKKTC